MRAVILAGGKGTRLRPYTTTLPKPLLPVGEQPILHIVLRQLANAGFNDITMAVWHMAELIMSFFGTGQRYGIDLSYSTEPFPLGTVGPLKLIRDLPEYFLVMNGDILTDLPYRDLYESHIQSGADLTIASFQRRVPIDFGVLQIDPGSSQVTGFSEKPTHSLHVSMGIYVFSRALLARIPEGTPYGLDNLVLDMLSRGEPIHTYPHSGYWLDLGRPDDFDRANTEIHEIPAFQELLCSGPSR